MASTPRVEDMPQTTTVASRPQTRRCEPRCEEGAEGAEDEQRVAGCGLHLERHHTQPGTDPMAAVDWQRCDARIEDVAGQAVFEQRCIEVPAEWSELAANVMASKYFRGALGSDRRETSVRQPIDRVVETVSAWGRADGYFEDDSDAATFRAELQHILLHQMACFNSPVWFNIGIEPRPQCSACFIVAVEDSLPSILDLVKTEGMLFKYGSGAGSNLSKIRSSSEPLSGGGTASGPVSFMKGLDAFAGAIKSGGKTRRAAKMVILDIAHPDIVDFIRSKELEEGKAQALIAANYSASYDHTGGAYDSVCFQNANHTVRVSDTFMQAVVDDGVWHTRAVTDGRPVAEYPARELFRTLARAAWTCGDPGIQFDTTINAWHTCPASGRIDASNPCSEFMFVDNSACNLASLNLLRFYHPGRGFDVEGFQHTCEIMITAQDILIDHAGYPTPIIEQRSRTLRPLGLGYANLGALLMASGLAYDSAAGRALAAAVTALMTGTAYAQSARLAAGRGPFASFEKNRTSLIAVLAKHRDALEGIDAELAPARALAAAHRAWNQALALGERFGVRNSQVSALAPTGTIALMMDCDTTGIEPDVALIKHKKLVGGGRIKIANRTLPMALAELGYDAEATRRILEHLEQKGTVEGAVDLAEKHLSVFDCALRPPHGTRSIDVRGHLNMLAAVQPFLSGAISKTINMPSDATPVEIEAAYLQAWRIGLKAVAIYRDGSKGSQPLDVASKPPRPRLSWSATRQRLPAERPAITHKFSIGQHEGYVTAGLFDNGQPGEIFIVMAKQGSTISGLMDAFATTVSIALQSGVPLATLVEKFVHTRFEPAGFTHNPQIPYAKSLADYIFRWLASKFLDAEAQRSLGLVQREGKMPTTGTHNPVAAVPDTPSPPLPDQRDAPACHVCGWIMVRSGTCYMCPVCGTTSGCS